MSYPKLPELLSDENIKEFVSDLLYRKEFWQLKGDESSYNFRDPGKRDIIIDNHLRIHSHQLFMRNLINPNTSYDRMLVAHQPGTGKTLLALAVAGGYIDVYKSIYKLNIVKFGRKFQGRVQANKATPTVFFIGFTKNNIIKEILKYPELGFLSIQEKYELDILRANAKNSINDNKRYKEFYSSLKKRITNKHLGGFYEFYGYQELVNRLFTSEGIDLTELEKKANKFTTVVDEGEEVAVDIEDLDEFSTKNKGSEGNVNDYLKKDDEDQGEDDTKQKSLEDIIIEYIKDKKIQVNTSLLERFEDSLIICDEAHYMYNSFMKNNYGVALQYLLDTVKNCKLLLLTATPVNNMAPEIIDVLNFLLPTKKKLNKRDFFFNNKREKPGAIEKIAKLSFGRVSFLQDVNPLYFPEKIWPGKIRVLRQPYEGFTEIPYLRFIECPLTEYQFNTYKQFLEDTNQLDSLERTIVSSSNNVLSDIIFPNPDNDEIGLYNSIKIRGSFTSSKKQWRDKIGLELYKFGNHNIIYSGKWLSKENLKKYSAKYYKMVEIIEESFAKGREILSNHESELSVYQASRKMIIYHNQIKMGVIIIQEIVKTMGILDEHSSPSELTICTFCGGIMKDHKAFIKEHSLRDHDYYPARFVIMHSEIDQASIESSKDKFNTPDNAYGGNFKILIGSKMIAESHDMKDVRDFIITSAPQSASKLNQLLGRGDRNNSHINLPHHLRTITIYPLLTILPQNSGLKNNISAEEYKYLVKLSYYLPTQKVLSAIYSYSVDAIINRDIIMPPELQKEYFPYGKNGDPVPILKGLYFDPAVNLPSIDHSQVNMSTFLAYGHVKEEIENIIYIIKRLFIESPVWSFDNLWAKVKHPPFAIEVNPGLFQKENFIIALNNFVEQSQTVLDKNLELDLANNLIFEKVYASLFFDPNNFYIYKNSKRHKIQQVGKYYILFPVNIEGDSHETVKDIDVYAREDIESKDIIIDVNEWNTKVKSTKNYKDKNAKFMDKYSNVKNKKDLLEMLEFTNKNTLRFIYYNCINNILDNKYTGAKINNPKLIKLLIEFLSDFDGIIFFGDIRGNTKFINETIPDGGDQVIKDMGDKVSDDTPIGFQTTEGIFIRIMGYWKTVSKASLGKHIDYKENNKLIGYYEKFSETKNKFKLRSPLSKIQNIAIDSKNSNLDLRNFERGIVCETKNKDTLLGYAKLLGIDINKYFDKPDKKKPKGNVIKIRNVCLAIRDELIRKEIIERKKKSDIKYFYLWYENMPTINTIIVSSAGDEEKKLAGPSANFNIDSTTNNLDKDANNDANNDDNALLSNLIQ